MATDSTDLVRFRRFVDEQLAGEAHEVSLAEAIARFEAYEAEKARFGETLQESIEQARRGEAAPLDCDALKNEIRAELADEGIND